MIGEGNNWGQVQIKTSNGVGRLTFCDFWLAWMGGMEKERVKRD